MYISTPVNSRGVKKILKSVLYHHLVYPIQYQINVYLIVPEAYNAPLTF
jgi:hypothetical protein